MIPFNLLFQPNLLFRHYPVRDWRDITLWLKWGLLFSLVGILVRVSASETFSGVSTLFWVFERINRSSASFQLPVPFQFAFFFIFLCVFLVVTWLVKAGIIYTGYQFLEGQFLEGRVALSIAGGSMVANVWILVPVVGSFLAVLHGCFLCFYLILRIHRVGFTQALVVGILAGVVPVLY